METLVGWRILSQVEEIQSGKYARTQAVNWESSYGSESLMLEMMAQTGGLVVGSVNDFSGNLVFAKVELADFMTPGPRSLTPALVIEAFAREGVNEQGAWIEAQIYFEEKKIAFAKFFLVEAGDLSRNGKSITFHPEFLEYYKIREKTKG